LIWGLLGAFFVEALELVRAIQRVGGWPWDLPGEVGLGLYLTSVVIRLALGGGIAYAAGASGQVSTPLGALAAGLASPLIIEKLSKFSGTAGPLHRESYAFDESAPAPRFRTGQEPAYARVGISSRSAAILRSLSDPDIPEAIASDVGLSVSEVTASVSYLVRRGYVEEVGGGDRRFQLTSAGHLLLRRLEGRDPNVLILDDLSADELPERDRRGGRNKSWREGPLS